MRATVRGAVAMGPAHLWNSQNEKQTDCSNELMLQPVQLGSDTVCQLPRQQYNLPPSYDPAHPGYSIGASACAHWLLLSSASVYGRALGPIRPLRPQPDDGRREPGQMGHLALCEFTP